MFSHAEEGGQIVLTRYSGAESNIHLPDEIEGKSVTAIGEFCFKDSRNIQTITLHSAIDRIGDGAFYNCSSLEHISLDSVATLGVGVFQGCVKLRTAVIGLRVNDIEAFTFFGCSSLTQITLRGNCRLRPWSFACCSSMEFPLNIKGIGNAIVDTDTFQDSFLSTELKANLDPQKKKLFVRGEDLLIEGKYRKAIKYLMQSADMGFVAAQRALGQIYYHGKGTIQKDYSRAHEWFEMAAEMGDSYAQFCLGHMYHMGEGVEVDFDEARCWYEQAVLQGSREAQNNLIIISQQE